MSYTRLKLKDGFGQSPLHNEVIKLQHALQNSQALQNSDYSIDTIDGLFGEQTENVVKVFQRYYNLEADGIVGEETWWASEEIISSNKFRGNLKWIHICEGHKGCPYWPGGGSGVTIDPGIDLGQVDHDLLDKLCELYSELKPEDLTAIEEVYGIKGEDAKKALQESDILKNIRISRSNADKIFPDAAKPYWDKIVERFPTLDNEGTLSSVQTVMLSLSYNRGAGNEDFVELEQPIKDKNWFEVANIIGSMQQNHDSKGIIKRRNYEAKHILQELVRKQA